VTDHRRLFDTVFVYENYPTDAAALSGSDGLSITHISNRDLYHYPLTVQAVPGHELTLHVQYRADVFDPSDIAGLIERFQHLLAAMTTDPARPLNAQGLPAAPRTRAFAPEHHTNGAGAHPPATLVQQILAGIYAQVLGVERVAADASFFDLGGDSLSAMRAVAAINSALGVDLSVRALIETPSVLELGRRLNGHTGSVHGIPVVSPAHEP
jgi:non-ribosomal peptide synthetase component F